MLVSKLQAYCLEIIHKLGNFYTQLSCVSSSPELSNRERFKYHFQLRATEADLAIGFYSIIRHFKWRKVAIFIQQERLFEAVCSFAQHTARVTIIKFCSIPFIPINFAVLTAKHSLHVEPEYLDATNLTTTKSFILYTTKIQDQNFIGLILY